MDAAPIIGLEIHVQLATRTKLFCGCALQYGAAPNSRTCPVCIGLPGALPVINEHAVELAIRTGLALHCQIADETFWERKSYYYPDLPKNYQISQLEAPLCGAGWFELPHDGAIRKLRIRRAHLEEDAGKNVHDYPGVSAIDLNRAGTPLLEIVTEPELRSADEAREFAVQLHRLVRYLGVSEANMQQGQMRFEPNVNLRIKEDGQTFYTPIVEVKNLNSFKSLHGAIEYEIARQLEAWRETREQARPGNKRNRGWDDQRQVTVPQREKEESSQYRYFRDPDLVPLRTDAVRIQQWRDEMAELPIPRSERFICEYKVSPRDAGTLVDDRGTADLLDAAVEAGGCSQTLARHFLSFWSMHANQQGVSIAGLGVPASTLAELSTLQRDRAISATAAAQLAEALLERVRSAAAIGRVAELAAELGLLQLRDESQTREWITVVLREHAQAVHDARENPRKRQAARGFLTGQVMKLSAGRADPQLVGELLAQALDAPAQ